MDKILLFIPMYNCEKQITRVLGQLDKEILKYITEVIVVNNRSTDHGEKAAVDYCRQHPNLPVKVFRNTENYGLGGSHKVAFQYAAKNEYDYVIILHGDDQGNISNILPYLKNGEYQNYDCFLGARFMKGSQLQGYSKFRTFGNYVYNILFSLGVGYKIYDLGSGLNMYKVNSLKSNYYLKFKDNLMFNYCMVLGSAFYKQRIKFFPILWREDDQVSNVKMLNQAITVLQLLGSYILNKNTFIAKDHRDKKINEYSAQIIYCSQPSRSYYEK